MNESLAEAQVRRRPRDRRQAIGAAAALAFAERGYHRVSMQDVADAVGITAAALYRHFDAKYDLFREVALALASDVSGSVAGIAAPAPGDVEAARADMNSVVDAVIGATLTVRATGGIYRWESRYLRDDDRRELASLFASLRARLALPLATVRPELDAEALDLTALAALSVTASLTMHRTTLPVAQIRSVLHDAALRVLEAPIAVRVTEKEVVDEHTAAPPRRRRDQIAHAGVALFAARGYHDASIEDIAAAVGLTPSGVYRHVSGKSEILRMACERAAVALDAAAEEALQCEDDAAALPILERAYIDFAVDDRDLMGVYAADVGALEAEDQRRLRRLQRDHVDDWVELLGRVRPDLEPRSRRFLVHAGLNVVADLSVAFRHLPPAAAKARIAPALEAVLAG